MYYAIEFFGFTASTIFDSNHHEIVGSRRGLVLPSAALLRLIQKWINAFYLHLLFFDGKRVVS